MDSQVYWENIRGGIRIPGSRNPFMIRLLSGMMIEVPLYQLHGVEVPQGLGSCLCLFTLVSHPSVTTLWMDRVIFNVYWMNKQIKVENCTKIKLPAPPLCFWDVRLEQSFPAWSHTHFQLPVALLQLFFLWKHPFSLSLCKAKC